MAKRKGVQLSVRGVMKKGRVVLLDDIEIANGSLLDIVVVETPEEQRLKASKKKREADPSPLSFCLVGKKQFTSDPVLFFKRLGNSTVSNVRFDGYKATCHIIPADPECALAEYMLSFAPPPPKVAKAFRKVIRQRTRFEFNPGTRKATKLGDELKILCEAVPIGDTASGIDLWYAAIPLIIGNDNAVTKGLLELFEFGPLAQLEKEEATKSVAATAANKIQAESMKQIESGVRSLVFDQLKRAAVRSRRKNGGTSTSDKLLRNELSEIAKRLEAKLES